MKAYVKPQLQVEYFTLSQNIASGCNVPGGGNSFGKPTHWSKDSCGWDLGGWVIWSHANTCQNELVGPEENIVGLCYNNPNGGCTIFSS